MNELNKLSEVHCYECFSTGQKRFYRLVPIPFLDLSEEEQLKIREIEDNE